jgi:prophage regulatory protein
MKAVLRPRQVYELIGLSAMQVWRLRRDGRFPQPIALGVNSKGFLKEEIDAWIEARVAERDARQQRQRAATDEQHDSGSETP